jgi:uncharacterized protein YjbI with pentapeptide repeats
MKVLKKNEHAPIFRPFGVGGKLYLAVASLTFFDLSEQPRALTEQDMWKTLPAELGASGVLDSGLPKAVGEVLVAGSCFAPGRTPVPVAEASFRVGPVAKKLTVFGDRFWSSGSSLAASASAPRPFASMPLTWERSFGGPDFEANPLGKGASPVAVPGTAETIWPLPNIEPPDKLVADPRDRPEPAGFGPRGVTHPARKALCGTYDATWQREHWPYFPADYKFAFANEAPPDQWLAEGYFSGGEAVEIAGMHPDIARINARIPELRVRIFATQVAGPLGPGGVIPDGAKDNFVEIETRIDTVRLFPGVERGVIVHRGVLPIADDEYRDVRRLYFVTEYLDDPPKPAEYYAAEQAKLLDRMVPVKTDPTAEVNKKISRAMLKVNAIPAMIETAKKRALGQSPVMPVTTADMAKLSESLGARLGTNIEELEALARGMHAKYGHMMEIDLTQFDRFRQSLADAQTKATTAIAKVDAAQAKGQAAMESATKTLKEKVKPEHLAKAGVDPDNLFPPRKVNPWHDAAFPFVIDRRRDLESYPEAMGRIRANGLKQIHSDAFWLGINIEDRGFPGPEWGLPEGQTVTIPKGLVFAEFTGPVCDRIQILSYVPNYFCTTEEEFLVAGSARRNTFFPSIPGAPVVVVPRAFGGMLLYQHVSDFAGVLVACNPKTPLTPVAAKAVKDASAFLVVLPQDERYWDKVRGDWKAVHPKAAPVYLPGIKFLSEAKAANVDLREMILDALPPASVGLPEGDEAKGPPKIAPFPDVRGMILAAIDEVKAALEPRFDAAKALQAKSMDMVKESLAKAGKDPEAILAQAAAAPKPTLADGAKQAASSLDKAREHLRTIGQLTSERAEKLDSAQSTIAGAFADADKQLAEGKQKIEAGKKQIAEAMAKVKAGEMPEKAKRKFAAVGMDPDMIRQFSREEVIDFHAGGKSLAGAMFTGLDLSGLDLSGADLRQTIARKCNFAGTDLTGADLSKAAWSECDLGKAKLERIKADTFVIQKSKCDGASFAGGNFKQAIFKDGSLVGADFASAVFELSILSKNPLDKANFRGAAASLSVFDGSGEGADFRDAKLSRCVLKKMRLGGATFAGATVESTVLQACEGAGVSFEGADLRKMRLGASALPGANLRGARLNGAGFRDSDLSGADVTGARLDGAIIENCDLSGAVLDGSSAKRARFTRSNLEGAGLRGIDMGGGSLRKARIVSADLSGGNFFGVDFFKAVVGETDFHQANLKLTFLHKREDLLK